MGEDENALLRLWREKRGEAEPEDLSGNLIVRLSSSQVGASTAVVTQHLFPLLYPATSEAQTFAPAVLRKKLNPGCLESLLHCLDGCFRNLPSLLLKVYDRRQAQLSCVRQLRLGHVQKSAGGPTLRRRHEINIFC